MLNTLLQMMLILSCGLLWAWLQPGGLDVQIVRKGIITLVYYLLLPALVLSVMWRASVGIDSLHIAIVSAVSVFAMLGIGWLLTRMVKLPPKVAGAAILAVSFPNTVYLGLPVLVASFGAWASSVAIQYDLLASTPLMLSVGVMIAQRYGESEQERYSPIKALLKVPPLWAMGLALCLNVSGIMPSALLQGFFDLLGDCVVPLMLISLGMSLQWRGGMQGHRWLMLVIIVLQLLVYPLIALAVANIQGMQNPVMAATVMEAAMPCMVLGIVVCDRYHLDTAFYAAVVTISTLISVASLPIWLHILTQ